MTPNNEKNPLQEINELNHRCELTPEEARFLEDIGSAALIRKHEQTAELRRSPEEWLKKQRRRALLWHEHRNRRPSKEIAVEVFE